ncbi:MAG: hypothetical protein HY258_01945, partial [Chloroflexi bacterium]|nr:hypothetical protein [Chloroflexota bacterium]
AIISKLDQLADLQNAIDVTKKDYEAKRAEILKSVQAELDALTAEYDPLITSAEERSTTLEKEIRGDVIAFGASVKGKKFYAMFSRGRITWNTKALDEFAVLHPEVIDFRKQGEPSVSIRLAK